MNVVTQRLVTVALTLLAVIFGLSALFGESAAQPPPDSLRSTGQAEFVMLRCSTTSSDFSVLAYRGSSAAPSKKGENCPEVLAQLARDGFVVANVGHYDWDSDYATFLLSRGQ
jgi:hypothetical protein